MPRQSLSLSTFALLFSALINFFVSAQLVPLPPPFDPFYQPPTTFASSPPGTVLRSRPVNAALLGLVPEPVQAYQLLYRTTAIDGTPIATVTTIFKPLNATTDRFVSFHMAYDSSAPKCAPSYNYQLGGQQTNLIVTVENLLLQAYLASGYIVSSPDYEGPEAAFSAGHLSGMAVLDSMRAVRNFAPTLGLSKNPAIFGSGYSGGAIASGWAAALQHVYAPELNIKGWASGGTPANLTGTLYFIDRTLFAGFLPVAFAGLNKPTSYAAQLSPLINSIITPQGAADLAAANQECAVPLIFFFAGQSVLSTDFQSLGDRLPYNPIVASVLQQQILGINKTETPVAPVLLYHAVPDEIIPYANASTLNSNWCADGASVHFTTYANGGHFTTEILGLVPVLQFAAAAFAGTVAPGCSQDTVLTNTLDPLALGVDLEPILVQLINALLRYGDNDINLRNNLGVLNQTV